MSRKKIKRLRRQWERWVCGLSIAAGAGGMGSSAARADGTWLGDSGVFSDDTKWLGGVEPAAGIDTVLTFQAGAGFYFVDVDLLSPYTLNGMTFESGTAVGLFPAVPGAAFSFTANSGSSEPFIEMQAGGGFVFFASIPIIVDAATLEVRTSGPGATVQLEDLAQGATPARLIVTGGGTVGLFGSSNTLSGGVEVIGSEVHVGSTASVGAGPIRLVDGALRSVSFVDLGANAITLEGSTASLGALGPTDSLRVGNLASAATGTMALSIVGQGATTVAGISNLAGGDSVLVNPGARLVVETSTALGGAKIQINGGSLLGDGTINFASNAITFTGSTGTLGTVDAADTLRLGGPLTHPATGTLTVDIAGPGRTTLVGTSGLTSSDVIRIQEGSQLAVSTASSVGPAAIRIAQNATLLSDGAASLSGNVAVTGSTANIGTILAPQTLSINGLTDLTPGAVTVNVVGPGRVHLRGASNLTNADHIDLRGGTMVLNAASAVGSASINVQAGALLADNIVNLTSNVVTLSGTAATFGTPNFSGRLLLNNVNTSATATVAITITGSGATTFQGVSNLTNSSQITVNNSTLNLTTGDAIGQATLINRNSSIVSFGPSVALDLRNDSVFIDGATATFRTGNALAPILLSNLSAITPTGTATVLLQGPALITLEGTSNFTQSVQVSIDNTRLQLDNTAAIGDARLHVGGILQTGTSLDLTGHTVTVGSSATLNTTHANAIIAVDNALFAGGVTLTATLNVTGPGTVSLEGVSNFIPTHTVNVTDSRLLLDSEAAIGQARLNNNGGVVVATGDVDLSSNVLTVNANARFESTPGHGVILRNIGGAATATIAMELAGAGVTTLTGSSSLTAGHTIRAIDTTVRLDAATAIGGAELRLDNSRFVAGADLDLTDKSIVLAGSLVTIDSNNNRVDFGGFIGTGTADVSMLGGGRIVLTGVSTDIGAVHISEATRVEVDDASHLGTALSIDDGTLAVTKTLVFPHVLEVGGTFGGTVDLSSGGLSVQTLTGSGPLNKVGAFDLIILDSSGFSGAVSIEGMVELNGGQVSGVTMAPNSTLAGNAKVLASLSVTDGSALAPGAIGDGGSGSGSSLSIEGGGTVNSIIGDDTVGLLEFAGGLAFDASSAYQWQLGSLTDDLTGDGGIDFDQILLSGGTLAISPDAVLAVFLTNGIVGPDSGDPFWLQFHEWKVLDVAGDGSNPGADFLSILASPAFDGQLTTRVGTGADAGDIFLQFTPSIVPEPSTATFTAGALLLLILRPRRRKPPRITLRLETGPPPSFAPRLIFPQPSQVIR